MARARSIPALVLLAAALGGCADILGYSEYTFGTGGKGGTTGTAGSGGAAGTTASTSATGTAATAGTGGTGGLDPSCMTHADCAGSPYGEKCDPDTMTCVECLPG